jgi:hypothetical protein
MEKNKSIILAGIVIVVVLLGFLMMKDEKTTYPALDLMINRDYTNEDETGLTPQGLDSEINDVLSDLEISEIENFDSEFNAMNLDLESL